MKLGLKIANPQITNCKRDCVRKSENCHICERSQNLTVRKFADLLFAEFICGPLVFAIFHLDYILTKGTSHSAYNLLSYIYKFIKLYLKRSRDKSIKETLLSKKIKFQTLYCGVHV
jgi:hypothetical protein